MAKFKWTVEIEAVESIVADGFELDDRSIHDALCRAFPLLRMSEIGARVVKQPDAELVATTQGYKSAADKAAREAK